MVYLDTSALVKLVLAEPESPSLFTWLKDRPERISSWLAAVELQRAVNRVAPRRLPRARRVLDHIALLDIDQEILDTAARLEPRELRSLDALHLASAVAIQDHLQTFVAYDERLLKAARAIRLPTASPGA